MLVTLLSKPCDWTGEEVEVGGDWAIHDRDLDWLQQSDGNDWSLVGGKMVWGWSFFESLSDL